MLARAFRDRPEVVTVGRVSRPVPRGTLLFSPTKAFQAETGCHHGVLERYAERLEREGFLERCDVLGKAARRFREPVTGDAPAAGAILRRPPAAVSEPRSRLIAYAEARGLPPSDIELAEIAGFGRNVGAFRARRDELLAGFSPDDDGRLVLSSMSIGATADSPDSAEAPRVGESETESTPPLYRFSDSPVNSEKSIYPPEEEKEEARPSAHPLDITMLGDVIPPEFDRLAREHGCPAPQKAYSRWRAYNLCSGATAPPSGHDPHAWLLAWFGGWLANAADGGWKGFVPPVTQRPADGPVAQQGEGGGAAGERLGPARRPRRASLIAPLAPEMEREFEEFWQSYPWQKDKGAARAAYRDARDHASGVDILRGARRYAGEQLRDPTFTKSPANWLDDEGWSDREKPRKTGSNPYDLERRREQERTQDALAAGLIRAGDLPVPGSREEARLAAEAERAKEERARLEEQKRAAAGRRYRLERQLRDAEQECSNIERWLSDLDSPKVRDRHDETVRELRELAESKGAGWDHIHGHAKYYADLNWLEDAPTSVVRRIFAQRVGRHWHNMGCLDFKHEVRQQIAGADYHRPGARERLSARLAKASQAKAEIMAELAAIDALLARTEPEPASAAAWPSSQAILHARAP